MIGLQVLHNRHPDSTNRRDLDIWQKGNGASWSESVNLQHKLLDVLTIDLTDLRWDLREFR